MESRDKNLQINHKDDNKNNNYYQNLYQGTQKENIADCIKNGHRKGHMVKHTIYDKQLNKELIFDSCKDFMNYAGHPQSNGSLNKCLSKKWFNDRFVLIT